MKLKIVIKKIILTILAFLGYGTWYSGKKLLRRYRRPEVRILRFHSVSDFRRHETNVKVDEFRRQMKFIREHYHPLSLDCFMDSLLEQRELPPKAVVVTFDDGYRENFLHAYPVLQEFEIPATFFLLSDFVGTAKILPHDREDSFRYNYLLSWDEVREMQKQGMGFGSHGSTHIRLKGETPGEIEKEFRSSKAKIEKETGRKVRFISYPFGTRGDFSEESKRFAATSGYQSGYTAIYGSNNLNSDPYELRRIGIEAGDNGFTFRAKLNGALDILLLKETRAGMALIRILNFILGV
jgi:peptidoglycan/xylan/chitin deacetylase (PgdA/CDA1 family)